MRKLDDMIKELADAKVSMKELLSYCIDINDKKTTLFEAVNDLYSDYFAEEIEAEERESQNYWDSADEAYERKRDEDMGL